jgi:hypothetical protein
MGIKGYPRCTHKLSNERNTDDSWPKFCGGREPYGAQKMNNAKVNKSIKKHFEQNERQTDKNKGNKGRIEYLCLVPGCNKGVKEFGLLARSNGSIAHLKNHLDKHVGEDELDMSASGRFIKRDTTTQDEAVTPEEMKKVLANVRVVTFDDLDDSFFDTIEQYC